MYKTIYLLKTDKYMQIKNLERFHNIIIIWQNYMWISIIISFEILQFEKSYISKLKQRF